jgi:sporulation protein YlmC with PRC-barrel domain
VRNVNALPPTEQADRVSKIIGKGVITQKGEDLGKSEDLVVSKEARLDHIILAPRNLMGPVTD